MATALNYGGWFDNQGARTGAFFDITRVANALAVTMLVGVGTGRFVDDLDRWQQHRSSDSFVSSSTSNVIEITLARTAADDISRIREILSPSISGLANILGVTRQAIYNWLNGEQPRPEYVAKLADLAQAADLLAETGVPITGALMKRKLFKGKNLLEVACDGGSARDAAQVLVQIVRRETSQRAMMSARFSGRKTSSRAAEWDIPAENDAG